MMFKNRRYPTELLFQESKLLTVEQLYIKTILRFMLTNTYYRNNACADRAAMSWASTVHTIKYLDGRLNVKTMYEIFIKKWPDLDVKYEYYPKYFNENYSLRFGTPQVDVCS
nr:unnamed protein product [Callosobruchus chinensis]